MNGVFRKLPCSEMNTITEHPKACSVFRFYGGIVYAPTKWGAYSVALVRPSIRTSVRANILGLGAM
jgi:hypothetical protein